MNTDTNNAFNILPNWPTTHPTCTIKPPRRRWISPADPFQYEGPITLVDGAERADAMLRLVRQRPLACIGCDTEFQYERPPVALASGGEVYDPTSIRPLALSLALVEPLPDNGSLAIYRFVVDLRARDVLESTRAVLAMPVPFCAHFCGPDLHCLWAAGLSEPRTVWDTWVAEKAFVLGVYNKHYVSNGQGAASACREGLGDGEAGADGDDERLNSLRAVQAEEAERLRLDLVHTCLRYGVSHDAAADKARLQRSFLDHASEAPFSTEQVAYAAADAVAAAMLYPRQTARAARDGILHHLVQVEMPWAPANARFSWTGVRIDERRRDAVSQACCERIPALVGRLTALGVTNHRSHSQLAAHFARIGLLEAFRRRGKITFEKKVLKDNRELHPSAALIHEVRRLESLHRDAVLDPRLVGHDGRVHPAHRQLGADTGRQSCRAPNVLGLDRTLRPLVIPEDGCGIGEVDLSQIEVGVAAAVYGDDRLVEMFNGGDVYSAMAQMFYADELHPDERTCSGGEFKRRRPALRDRMKSCTLGIIYGLTPHGLAVQLSTTVGEAAALQGRFMDMFPALDVALGGAWQSGAQLGYAATVTGLRRYRASDGSPTSWERNWLTNHPVQGSAAAAFKLAGIRLDRLYPAYGARLIIPFHDAYVFEAPLNQLADVADLTRVVMCQAVQEMFPALRPRVEMNIRRPECWNKDGDADALDRWLRGDLPPAGTGVPADVDQDLVTMAVGVAGVGRDAVAADGCE